MAPARAAQRAAAVAPLPASVLRRRSEQAQRTSSVPSSSTPAESRICGWSGWHPGPGAGRAAFGQHITRSGSQTLLWAMRGGCAALGSAARRSSVAAAASAARCCRPLLTLTLACMSRADEPLSHCCSASHPVQQAANGCLASADN